MANLTSLTDYDLSEFHDLLYDLQKRISEYSHLSNVKQYTKLENDINNLMDNATEVYQHRIQGY